MSSDEYENVVAGKLRLKGKALEVKTMSKKKKQKKSYQRLINQYREDLSKANDGGSKFSDDGNETGGNGYEERLTKAERRYLEQWNLEAKRLIKDASESNRDRINKFNQYLANLTEHYNIPKVGPG